MAAKTKRPVRRISHTELTSALTCEARWDFGYGGHLTGGDCLKRRALAPVLENGRAWGAGVAAWHAFPEDPTLFDIYQPMIAKMAAHEAMRISYAKDIADQAERGIFVDVEQQTLRELWLGEMLDHYMATAEKLPNLTRLEGELLTPIPSRGGKRTSSVYRFEGYIDGFTDDPVEGDWTVEYKLRTSLTPVEIILNSRQPRYYGWAHQQRTKDRVVGAIVEERLAAAPRPPKIVRAKRKGEGIQFADGNWYVPSETAKQACLASDYLATCEEFGVAHNPDTYALLEQRVWQQRVPIVFRDGELEEAGKELVSAAKLIRDLDTGERYPIRNTQAQLCRGCRYREACPNPGDALFVDTIFTRTVPKRLREEALVDPSSVPPKKPEDPAGSKISGEEPGFTAPFTGARNGSHGSAFDYANATYDYPPAGVA